MNKLILLLSICGICTSCVTTTSEITYIGNVVKISKDGFFCPTYEVEIIRTKGFINGLNNNVITSTAGREEYFTVENIQQLELLKKSMENQSEVEVSLHQELFTICRSSSYSIFLDTIRVNTNKE